MPKDLITNPTPPKLVDLSKYRRLNPSQSAMQEAVSLPRQVNTHAKLEDYKKYSDGNLINPLTQNIDKLRAENQGSLEQFRRFGAQVVAGEIVGGTIEGIGYLAELLNYDNAIWGSKDSFSNALSEFGTSIKESVQDTYPIYEEEPGSFNMMDTGWWAKNGVSVASMIPLIVGSGVATKGLGYLGKGISSASKLTSTGRKAMSALEEMPAFTNAVGTTTQALLSRHMENSMEATQFFDEKYKEGLDRGLSEEQASEYASIGASSIYKRNYWMLLQDISQFGLLRKLGGASKIDPSEIATKGTLRSILGDMTQEGAEEAFQYVISEEADYISDLAAGIRKENKFNERLGGYVNGELLTSAFFGALGSGLVQSGAHLYGKRKARNDDSKINDPQNPNSPQSITKNNVIGELYYNALKDLDPNSEQFKEVSEDLVLRNAIKSAKEGTSDTSRNLLKAIIESDSSELQSILNTEDVGLDPNIELSASLTNVFDIATEEYNKSQKYGNFAEPIAIANTQAKLLTERASAGKAEVENIKSTIPNVENLSTTGSTILEGMIFERAISEAIKRNKALKKNESTKEVAQSIEERLLSKKEKAKEKIKKIRSQERKEEEVSSDNEILNGITSFLEEAKPFYAKSILDTERSIHYRNKSTDLIEKLITGNNSLTKEEINSFNNGERPSQSTLNKIADKRIAGETLTPSETAMFTSFKEDINDIVNEKKKRRTTDTSGKKAEVGDIVRRNITGDTDYTLIEENGSFALEDINGNKIAISEADIETLIVQNNPEDQLRKSAESNSIPDSSDNEFYFEGVKPKDIDTRKNTIWSGAWKSANNTERITQNDPANSHDIALTNYLEDGQPVENGLYGSPHISPDEYDINSIESILSNNNEQEILNIPIRLGLTSSDGTQIIYNDESLHLFVHTGNYIDQVQDVDKSEIPSNDPREVLLSQRKRILNAIIQGDSLKVPIVSKGAGIVGYDLRYTTNVAQLLGNRDFELSILTESLNYKNGTKSFLDLPTGNKDQIGRLYAITNSANGQRYPVALERSKLDNEDAEIVYNLIQHLISDKNNNEKIDGSIKNTLINSDKNSGILEMYPDITYQELFNFLIYESPRTLGKNKVFRLDFENQLLSLSSNKDDLRAFSYEQIYSSKGEILDLLKGHYRNIHKNKLGDSTYEDYLIGNNIIYGSVPENQLFIQPVVYFGTPFVEDIAESEEVLINIPSDISKENVTRAFDFRKPDSDIMQLKEFAIGDAKGLIPILNNLKLRTGWNYKIVNEPDSQWAGMVKNDIILINSSKATKNTAFHEYLHPIIREIKNTNPRLYASLTSQLLTHEQGKSTYAMIKQKYGDVLDNDGILEETIVQLLGSLASNNIKTNSLTNVLRRIWNTILSYIKDIMPSVNISSLSLDTTLQDLADLMNSHSFIGVSNNPLIGYQKTNLGKKEYDAWVHTLLNAVMMKNNVYDISDVDNIDLSILESVINGIGYNTSNEDQLQTAKEVYHSVVSTDGSINQNSPFVQSIIQKLKTFGIIRDNSVSEEVEEEDVSQLGDSKQHYAINGKEKVTADIKFLMSFIPKVNSDLTSETSKKVRESIYSRDYKLNEITNLPEYHSFSNIWNTLVVELSGIIESKQPDSNNYEDLYEKYISKIEEIAIDRPEFNILIERLQNNVSIDESTKTRFVRAMYLSPQNYFSVLVSGNNNWSFVQKNPHSAEFAVSKRWKSNAIRNLTTSRKTTDGELRVGLSKEIINKVKQSYEELKELVNASIRKPGIISEEVINKAIDTLSIIGIEMEPRELNKYFKNNVSEGKATNKKESLSILREKISYYISELEDMYKTPITSETQWFIENEESVLDLARARGFFHMDLSDQNILGPDGKPYYNYSSHSMMSKRLEDVKNNPSYLEQLKTYPFYENSIWIDHLLSGKELKIHNFMNFKTFFDNGKRPKEINDADRIASSINMTLNGYLPLHARGSNATEFIISGFDPITAYSISGNNIELSSNAVDILLGYVADEHKRIQTEQKYLDSKPEILIDNYHVKKNGKVPALQLNIFPELQNGKYKSELLFDDKGRATNIDKRTILSDTKLKESIKQIFSNEVNSTTQLLEEFFIVNFEESSNNAIDKKTLSKYTSLFPSKWSNSQRFRTGVKASMFDYVFNSMLSNKEQQKLFSGDPALYGDQDNLQKRIISSGSMGYSSYMQDGQDENYTSAVMKDIKVKSKFSEYLKGIGASNTSDAQAYVTLDLYVDLLYGYGKWKPEYNDLISKIYSETITSSELSEFVNAMSSSDLTFQSMKTVHSELRIDENGVLAPRFIYDKQTIIPLIPSFISGTELEQIYDAMINQEVDHISFESGTKLGGLSPTSVVDKDGKIFDSKDIIFNSYQQSRRYTFLQQDLPKKGIGSILEPSQLKHMIMIDINDDEIYGSFTGKEIKNEIHRLQSKLSNLGAEELQNKLFTGNSFDSMKANNLIIEEITKRTIDDMLIEGLSKNYPIEAIPGKVIPIQNSIASIINKTTVRMKHSTGGSFLQASGVGIINKASSLSKEQMKGITWLTDEALVPPILENGELYAGQVIIPSDIYQKYPEIQNDPYLARELLQGIGSRIPNQAFSNSTPLEVVGILPIELGDTIIVYDEMFEQMGSDNDGDKIYFLMYNLHPSIPERIQFYNFESTPRNLGLIWEDRNTYENMSLSKAEFIQRYTGSNYMEFNSRTALENYKLDLYRTIMSNEDAFNRMMTSLESKEVENSIKNQPNFESSDLRNNLNPLNGMYQSITRGIYLDANSSVGVVANHTTDHAKSQYKDTYVINEKGEPFSLGIGNIKNIDGVPASIISEGSDRNISRLNSLIMSAEVDAEKDPYVAQGNYNLQTISPVLTMGRLGIPINFISELVGSQTIREYIRVKRGYQISFIYPEGTSIEQTLKNINKKNNTNYSEEDYFKTKYTPNPSNPLEQLKFYTTIEDVSTALSKSIKGSKFTVDGLGKSIFEAISLIKLRESSTIGNFNSKFYNEDGNPTMDQTYYENSIEFFLETFGKGLIANSTAFKGLYVNQSLEGGLIEEFAKRQNVDITNPSNIESIYRGFYSFIMSKPMRASLENLIGKENSVAKELEQIKQKEDLLLLNLLQSEFKNDIDLISFPNTLRFSEEETNLLYDDWKILQSKYPTFSKRLAQYAYASSGFNYTINGFFQFMPISVLEEFDIKNHINEVIKESNNPNSFDFALDQIIRNNPTNSALVPKISKKHVDVTSSRKLPNGIIQLSKSNKKFDTLPDYILYRDNLYLLSNKKEHQYSKISTLGYSESGFKIVEYDFENHEPQSFFNTDEIPKIKQENQIEEVPQKNQVSNNASRTDQLTEMIENKNDLVKFIDQSDFNSLREFVDSRPKDSMEELAGLIYKTINNC